MPRHRPNRPTRPAATPPATTPTPSPTAPPTSPQAAARKRRLRIIAKVAGVLIAIALLVFLIGGAVSMVSGTSADTGKPTTRTILLTTSWSEQIVIPPNQMVIWERSANVAYDARTQRPGGRAGETYVFPRDPEGDTRSACERHGWIPEANEAVEFRVIDQDMGEVEMKLTFFPYNGGPCRNSSPPKPITWNQFQKLFLF